MVVLDIRKLPSNGSSSHQCALQSVVSCLKNGKLEWQKGLCARQAFCWHIVGACCDLIDISHDDFTHYSNAVKVIASIYGKYCRVKYPNGNGRRHYCENLPEVVTCPEIGTYFKWIWNAQCVILKWKDAFQRNNVTYGDIVRYNENKSSLRDLASWVQVSPDATLTEKVANQALTSFQDYYDHLNFLLVKYISANEW